MSKKVNVDEIVIDGQTYVPKNSAPAVNTDGLPYVIVRSRDSGCHAGYLLNQDGATITLQNARRLWYWSGAATLSELATNGVKKPTECKFPTAVHSITVLGCCEIIPATEVARKSIEAVPIWAA